MRKYTYRAPAPRPPSHGHERPRKRSIEGPLWLVGAAVLIGYPFVRDFTTDRMQRNTYANAASCECAYGHGQCQFADGRWVGPWYAVDPEDRTAGDPGQGRSCGRSRSGTGSYGHVGSSGRDDVSSRTGVETGNRGGFGGTGRVRAAGS